MLITLLPSYRCATNARAGPSIDFQAAFRILRREVRIATMNVFIYLSTLLHQASLEPGIRDHFVQI